jgi:hypothetical protein
VVWFERAKKTRADRKWLRWAMGGRGKSQGRQGKNNGHGHGRTRFRVAPRVEGLHGPWTRTYLTRLEASREITSQLRCHVMSSIATALGPQAPHAELPACGSVTAQSPLGRFRFLPPQLAQGSSFFVEAFGHCRLSSNICALA